MIVLRADKAELSVCSRETLTSGAENVFPVRFEFSDDWEGLEKTAIFRAGCVGTAVPLTEESCLIPREPLAAPGRYLMAGVQGRAGDREVLPTVWANLGLIREGAAAGENVPPDVPPSGEEGMDHRALHHRDAPEQHPIAAISGLDARLNRIPEPAEALTNSDLEEILK